MKALKYSNVIITDDNSDNEMERLADQNGYTYNRFLEFVDSIGSGFNVQENKHGYEEWVNQKVLPNHSINCVAPITEAVLAYEFGNGYMLFGDRDSMWD